MFVKFFAGPGFFEESGGSWRCRPRKRRVEDGRFDSPAPRESGSLGTKQAGPDDKESGHKTRS
jgi:hypothetical protein